MHDLKNKSHEPEFSASLLQKRNTARATKPGALMRPPA
jgi:hypothetical protein